MPCRAAGDAHANPTTSMTRHPAAVNRLDQIGIGLVEMVIVLSGVSRIGEWPGC